MLSEGVGDVAIIVKQPSSELEKQGGQHAPWGDAKTLGCQEGSHSAERGGKAKGWASPDKVKDKGCYGRLPPAHSLPMPSPKCLVSSDL